ncbi:MAG TPA: DUF262 domain-containing HNH endonuclease family protein [Caulobacterales bacterium]|nr:DUF262 domain-containing HNH endonuclease family protein [Caulobacterales bacterium]
MLSAQILTVAQLFALGRFTPASVQRDYQWEERQCEELFGDLERVFAAGEPARDDADGASPEPLDDGPTLVDNETPPPSSQREYVLNAMVMRPVEHAHCEVFDGLQRLTTLTVLTCVLRDLCSDAKLAATLDGLVTDSDGKFRVVLPGKDPTLREEVQKRGEAGRARRSQPSSDMGARVRDACTLFRRELSRWTAERRHAFADFLMNRVQLVAISAQDPLLLSQIFVTTNARGLPLDKVGLFKGQLIDIAQDEASAQRIAQTWIAVQTLVGDDLEDLLAALDFIERREPQGAERLTKLADHLTRRYGGSEIGGWVSRFELYAGAWRDLHRRLFDPADPDLGASMWMLRLIKWREWKPLALIWTAQYLQQSANAGQAERARALFARRFDALHRRCMAITLTGNSDLDRAKIFARAIGQAAQRRDPLDRQGALGFDANAQARIQETLRLPLIHDDTRLALMRWIEARHWSERPPRAIARASVEHVLPLRPQAQSEWLKRFPNEETRFNICHALGNLAVIEYRANEHMGNADFAAKLPVLREQAQKFKLLQGVAAHQSWTADIIAARTKTLCDFVWRELQLPAPRTPKAQS